MRTSRRSVRAASASTKGRGVAAAPCRYTVMPLWMGATTSLGDSARAVQPLLMDIRRHLVSVSVYTLPFASGRDHLPESLPPLSTLYATTPDPLPPEKVTARTSPWRM